MYSEENFNKLKNTIWITRMARIHAEKRLLNNGHFYEWINVYYSCATIIFSILAYVNTNNNLSLLTIFMSISLLAAILYLNPQSCFNQAISFQKNYTELYKLECKLKYLTFKDTFLIKNIEIEYCNLIGSNSNHTSFDYYSFLNDYSNSSDFINRWNTIKYIYHFKCCWNYFLKFLIFILPILLYIIGQVSF